MSTIIDLGKKVKAKYPQYADMSDEEVGKKAKARYPAAYMDFTDIAPQETQPKAPKPSLGQAASTAAKSFITEALPQAGIGLLKEIPNLAQGMSTLGQKIINKATGLNQPITTIPERYTKGSTQLQRGGQAATQLAEMFIPAGIAGKISSKIPLVPAKSSLIRKVAQKSLKVGAQSLESGLEFGGKTLLQTGDVQKAKDVAIFSALVPPAANLFKIAGETVARKAIPLSVKEAKIIQSYQAKVPFWERVLVGTEKTPQTAGKIAFEKGLMGTESMIGVGAKRGSNNLWNNLIHPQLKKSRVKVNMKEFFKEAKQKIIKENPEISTQKSLLGALNSFKKDYKGIGKISIEVLQNYKKGWAKNIPEKVYLGKPITGAANNVKNIFADIARNRIYNALGGKAKQAYFDYGNLIGLQELGQKAMTGGKFKGGFGGFWSAVASTIITPIGTIGGRAIYKTGQGIEFVGKQGAKTLNDLFAD